MHPKVNILPEIETTLDNQQPIVALESTVISHGLPYPQNVALAQDMEAVVRENGATPATIAVIDGILQVGLTEENLLRLAKGDEPVRKLSRRDLGAAIAQQSLGATTVATTMLIAHWAGIRVFATGGIGGVHRGDTGDISADLIELSQTPVAVVCAGAKAILDLPKTIEFLETYGVPVIGYQTSELPAFYTPHSGIDLIDSANSPSELAAYIAAHWGLGLQNGVLVTAPIPAEHAMNQTEINGYIAQALQEASQQDIIGKDVTPFLLGRIKELSEGRSVVANVALLKNNARVAAQLAIELATLAG